MFRSGQGLSPLSHFNREEPMKNLVIRRWKEEEGQDLTEYALLLVLLSLAAVGALGTLANAINNAFSKAAVNLSST
jgi:Flp pilus assembly pilin Flp